MIKKIINIGEFNTITIKKMYKNGECVCDVHQIKSVFDSQGQPVLDEKGQVKTVITLFDKDRIITLEKLNLTSEEIEILNPNPIKLESGTI